MNGGGPQSRSLSSASASAPASASACSCLLFLLFLILENGRRGSTLANPTTVGTAASSVCRPKAWEHAALGAEEIAILPAAEEETNSLILLCLIFFIHFSRSSRGKHAYTSPAPAPAAAPAPVRSARSVSGSSNSRRNHG